MKKLFCCIAMVIGLFVFGGCSFFTQNTVREINENSNFEIEFLAKKADVDFSGFEVIPGFGCDAYYDPKYGTFEETSQIYDAETYVVYGTSGWPDTLSDWRVTRMDCTDPAIELFGVSVGDSYAAFKGALEDHGFERDTSRDMYSAEVYEKNDVEIVISIGYEEENYDMITQFSVRVDSTNLLGVVY